MNRDLTVLDVKNWTTSEMRYWIQNTELIPIRGLLKSTLDEITKLKLDGKTFLSLINTNEDKMADIANFHEYCMNTLNIKSFGTRERFYYALQNLNIQRFSEIKPKKFTLFESSESSSFNREDHYIGDFGISFWQEKELEKWLQSTEIFSPKEIESIMTQFLLEMVDGYVLYKILTYPVDDTKRILSEIIQIKKEYLERFYKVCLALYPLIKLDLARDLELKLPDACAPILSKIRSSDILSRKFQINDPKHLESIKSLCLKDDFKKEYLNLDFKLLLQKQIKINETNVKNEKLSLKSKSDEDLIEIKEELIEIKKENMGTRNLKVKLLITELQKGVVGKNVIQILSPVLDLCSLSTQYGLFHTALIIGKWLIEWNSGEICIPRYPLSLSSMLSFDIGEIEINSPEDLERVRDIISEFITGWNINMYYSNVSKESNHGNCQDFVDALIKKLGIRIEYKETALGEYLSRMRKYGYAKACFKLSPDFKEYFKIKQDDFKELKRENNLNELIFETHEELDKFCEYLKSVEVEIETKFKYEWLLLKGFDRSFWIRYYTYKSKHQKKKENEPLKNQESDIICPFHDPKEMSFVSNFE